MKKRNVLIYLILILLLIAVTFIFLYFQGIDRNKYTVEVIKKIDYTFESKFTGVIKCSKTYPIYIESNGIIEEVFAQEGSFVKKGEPLATFSKSSSFEIEKLLKINELDINEINLKLETLEYGTSKLELDTKNLEIKNIAEQIKAGNRKIPILSNEAVALRRRATALYTLFEQGGVSAIEAIKASTEASKKEAELEDLKMNLELLKQKYSLTFLGYESLKRDIKMQKSQLNSTLSKLTITKNELLKKKEEIGGPLKSPIDGVIIKNNIFSGKNISSGETLFTMAERGDKIVNLDIPLSEINLIKNSKKIEISNKEMQETAIIAVATLKRVSNIVNISPSSGEKLVNVELTLPETNDFNIGYSVEVLVIGETLKDILVVNSKALFFKDGLYYIFALKDEKIEKIKVNITRKIGEYLEVNNIEEGTEYIVNYNEFLKNNN